MDQGHALNLIRGSGLGEKKIKRAEVPEMGPGPPETVENQGEGIREKELLFW
jgi:hypothetical protein